MRAVQISVFLENRSGRLAEVTRVLAEAGVNIRALSVADTSDFGILRLIVDDNARAEEALRGAGFAVGKTDVVAVEVDDRPGGLHRLLDLLSRHGVNVEYMYAFVRTGGEGALMIFRFDDPDRAVRVLAESGVNVVEESRLYTL